MLDYLMYYLLDCLTSKTLKFIYYLQKQKKEKTEIHEVPFFLINPTLGSILRLLEL